jgi:hypothetical protein
VRRLAVLLVLMSGVMLTTGFCAAVDYYTQDVAVD